MVYHRDALRVEGVEDDSLKSISSIDESLPEKERVVLEFFQQAVIDARQLSGEDIKKLKDCGWSESEIVEMIDCGAFAIAEAFFTDLLVEWEDD